MTKTGRIRKARRSDKNHFRGVFRYSWSFLLKVDKDLSMHRFLFPSKHRTRKNLRLMGKTGEVGSRIVFSGWKPVASLGNAQVTSSEARTYHTMTAHEAELKSRE